jgi:hypothetical protein
MLSFRQKKSMPKVEENSPPKLKCQDNDDIPLGLTQNLQHSKTPGIPLLSYHYKLSCEV